MDIIKIAKSCTGKVSISNIFNYESNFGLLKITDGAGAATKLIHIHTNKEMEKEYVEDLRKDKRKVAEFISQQDVTCFFLFCCEAILRCTIKNFLWKNIWNMERM